MPRRSSAPPVTGAAELLGGEEPLRLLTQLVSIAPTNLEDPVHRRWEKPNYLRAAEAIVQAGRRAGLATRVYDPMVSGDVPGDWHNLPRPNVIVDLDVGAPETVLILAHYDVVPVPAEQLARWKSPPHTLTFRADGRLYGRGSSDDLGSGVVASLTAMKHLVDGKEPSRNVRLVACCDEETGGRGGIYAIRAHDALLPPDDPGRILRADIALIPDGSPETTAGSSGSGGLVGSFDRPVSLSEIVAYGQTLVDLHEVARQWRSVYASPDWPDRNAPDPVITGRASVTKFDVSNVSLSRTRVGVQALHAETDASNLIPRCVTMVFSGPSEELRTLQARLEPLLAAPFRLEPDGATGLTIPPGTRVLQLIGEAAHGGYPHRGHNPVPATLRLLRASIDRGFVDGNAPGVATFTVDLRTIPEMDYQAGLGTALTFVRAWTVAHAPHARIESPGGRSGYSLPVDHPAVVKLQRILSKTLGSPGVRGEYGATDASALAGLTTPRGEPLPALVFGSMDPDAHIHDVEESADPRMIAGVIASIERFVREP
jgi:acetylornithine deacetylase/succinyl-diaminopimelate desuccinylase-like protein